jgi:hypothetical protein
MNTESLRFERCCATQHAAGHKSPNELARLSKGLADDQRPGLEKVVTDHGVL